MDKTINATLIMRNDTAANWQSANPILKKGELGIETNTRKHKVGDGSTAWNSLKYACGSSVEVRTSAPTSADVDYEIGTLWLDTSTNHAYMLFSKTSVAVWVYMLDSESKAKSATKADSADKLTTPRSIELKGAVVSTTQTFDGSQNIAFTLVLANSGAIAGTYTKLTVNDKGIVTSASNLTADDIPTLNLAKISDAGTAASKNVGTAAGNVLVLDSNGKVAVAQIPNITLDKVTNAGTAASKDTGTSAGNVPVLDTNGKLATSVMPAISLTDVYTVTSQAAMLALNAQRGDMAIRTDIHKTFVLSSDTPSNISSWLEIITADCKVLSVNGKTGAVELKTTDIAEGSNLYFTDARATSNFNTNFAKKSITDLSGGDKVVLTTDNITINGGKA